MPIAPSSLVVKNQTKLSLETFTPRSNAMHGDRRPLAAPPACSKSASRSQMAGWRTTIGCKPTMAVVTVGESCPPPGAQPSWFHSRFRHHEPSEPPLPVMHRGRHHRISIASPRRVAGRRAPPRGPLQATGCRAPSRGCIRPLSPVEGPHSRRAPSPTERPL